MGPGFCQVRPLSSSPLCALHPSSQWALLFLRLPPSPFPTVERRLLIRGGISSSALMAQLTSLPTATPPSSSFLISSKRFIFPPPSNPCYNQLLICTAGV